MLVFFDLRIACVLRPELAEQRRKELRNRRRFLTSRKDRTTVIRGQKTTHEGMESNGRPGK
jgi:hypothetical protein